MCPVGPNDVKEDMSSHNSLHSGMNDELLTFFQLGKDKVDTER